MNVIVPEKSHPDFKNNLHCKKKKFLQLSFFLILAYSPDWSQFCVLLMDPPLRHHLPPRLALLAQRARFPEAEHKAKRHDTLADVTSSMYATLGGAQMEG